MARIALWDLGGWLPVAEYDAAATQQPLAVAVYLVRDLMFLARKTERPELETKARQHATQLLHDADWTDQTVWVDNRNHVRSIFAWTASVSTDDEVHERIAEALASQPALLEPIIIGVSAQSEQYDLDGGVSVDVHIKELPPWFPVSAVAAEIRRRYPICRRSAETTATRTQTRLSALLARSSTSMSTPL